MKLINSIVYTLLPALSYQESSLSPSHAARLQKVVENFKNDLPLDNPLRNKIEQVSNNNRGFSAPWITALLSPIYGYGCWCYFQDDHGKGRGPAVNGVDSICKTLQKGYSCILLEDVTTNNNCIPWEVNYNATTGLGQDPNEESFANLLNSKCYQDNDNDCAAKTCIVETYFIINLLEPMLNGDYSTDYNHENGFDTSTGCKRGLENTTILPGTTIGNGVTTMAATTEEPIIETACCGRYPFKKQYVSVNGSRECCQGINLYNPVLWMCCDDGSVSKDCNN